MPPATVTLLKDFCPFCFKGGKEVQVSKGSPTMIHKVQALHANNGNGLRVLDLKSPGEFCSRQVMCSLVCLVCGDVMIEGSDTDYELFQYLFCEETHRVELKFEITDAMTRHDLVWTDDPSWDLPVHARCCNKKTVCKCVVPLGTLICPVHKRSLEPRPCEELPSVSKKSEPRAKAKESEPRPVVQKTVIPAGMPIVTATASEKVRWLPAPTETTRAENAAITMEEPTKKRAKPLPKKKAEEPVQEDKTFKYKLDDWSRANTTWEGRTSKTKTDYAEAASGGWQGLGAHYETFNEDFHGPRVLNGVKGYRRAPDGKFQPTAADVNILNDDGTLTPDGGLSLEEPTVEAAASILSAPRAPAPSVKKKMVMSKKEERMAAAGRSCKFKLDSCAWATPKKANGE